MNGFAIFVSEQEREVKCCPGIADVPLSAQSDAITYQRGLNGDGL
jgi:hypothetical protein